ncbi:hypothetical protein [Brevundimonas goettingensis]|uniref:Uncharacterized protein n=1 Tax=Brevundimonas goettingensis TaxID=2774190 RepID=A0A975GVA8_9CAUL|nr:hypothetical protein [Brevundimonas goettingensis]QTC91197.1 hypothetical protein IFJ75_18700 [Brevundimonas goettingensis]
MAIGPLGFARRLLASRPGRVDHSPVLIEDPWSIQGEPTAPQPVHTLLNQIEAAALSVYEKHGLPTRVGQYARSARGRTWKFVAETLNAEERWALFLANDSGKGWRFASLEDLGLMEPNESAETRRASELLAACQTLRSSLTGQGTTSRADDIETALRLGSEWRLIELTLSRKRDGPLLLGKPRRAGKRAPPTD